MIAPSHLLFIIYPALIAAIIPLAWMQHVQSSQTSTIRQQNQMLIRDIARQKEQISMLNAEISYRVNVEKLTEIATLFTDFKPLNSDAIMGYDALLATIRNRSIPPVTTPGRIDRDD